MKTACVSRYGAYGDGVMITPVLRALKRDGYHVTMNCTEKCFEVLRHNPNIDKWRVQKTGEVPHDKLKEHWDKMATEYDRFINLNGSIEGRTLKTPGQQEYTWTKEMRHAVCNKNYMDDTMAQSGYPELVGELPELFFSDREEAWAKKRMRPGFNVLVSLSGSSLHKIYPHMDSVVQAILAGIPDAHVIAVGEPGCKGILTPHERLSDLCGTIPIRKTFVLCKHTDLVISTETSTSNAASCFLTPKVILLSHSSEENLTKYWKNCISVYEPKVGCYPCHKLHYSPKTCPIEPESHIPVCAALLHPQKVLEAVETHYTNFKKEKAA